MESLRKGLFIVLEGIDGSGKSTLLKNAHTLFKNAHIPVLFTQEPGGSAFGNQLREILQNQPQSLSSSAAYLLFAADRAAHIAHIIAPALKKNMLIISDRFSDSSLVYQGYGQGLDISMLHTINMWATQGITPDITFYLSIDVDTAYARINTRGLKKTTFEKQKKSFFKRLLQGYDNLYKNRSDVIILDAHKSSEQLAHEFYTHLIQYKATLSESI